MHASRPVDHQRTENNPSTPAARETAQLCHLIANRTEGTLPDEEDFSLDGWLQVVEFQLLSNRDTTLRPREAL
jgi:hypothetical protein